MTDSQKTLGICLGASTVTAVEIIGEPEGAPKQMPRVF